MALRGPELTHQHERVALYVADLSVRLRLAAGLRNEVPDEAVPVPTRRHLKPKEDSGIDRGP